MNWVNRMGRPLPAALTRQAASVGFDHVNRREFLALTTSFGATAATAYAMLGLPAPAQASTEESVEHDKSSIRIQMQVRALTDPRTYSWFEIANFSRGWLEYLVTYENDGTFQPQLLQDWDINHEATEYTLHLRKGVTWNNGDKFTSEDVARNIKMWCEKDVDGNSMTGRFAVLIDPTTNMAIEGAIQTPDAHTVKLVLPRADISLIAGMADYPAAIVHKSHTPETMLTNPVGTGPYLPERLEPGVGATLLRNNDHAWWNAGNGAWVEKIEFIDFGTDPSAAVQAAKAGQIDMTHTIEGSFIDVFNSFEGWVENEVITAATIVIRPNQAVEIDGKTPYADVRVRRAIQLAVDNEILLELGYSGRGVTAENHHVSPQHPDYATLPPITYDPVAARALMEDAGMLDFEHDLVSLDDDWRRNTADAVAALMTDAGLKVRRTILPGNDYWDNWAKFGFSATEWGHRPLGVQTYALAYRSGEAWNEFGWSNAEFDGLLEQALATLDNEKRRALMKKCEALVQNEGVTIQPFWRRLHNHTVEGLKGGEHHIAFEIRPAALRWT